MFDLKTMNPKEISAIEYFFEDENLNLEIRDPIEIEILESGHHAITDCDGIFVVSPKWLYISILKR